MDAKEKKPKGNRYKLILEKLFVRAYKTGINRIDFRREDIASAADSLGIVLPKNLGDVIYSARYRAGMPEAILKTQPDGFEWIIEGAGMAAYAFRLVREIPIQPSESLITIKIPNATPEIVSTYSLSDEQALLAKVRYNRLVDIFLGIAAYSLQNHLRTTVKEIGQMEIDEIYVGIDKTGKRFVVPVQAKGGSDRLSGVQARQDIAWCGENLPELTCRAVATQFMSNDKIAMFALTIEEGEIRVVEEKHYRLVTASEMDS